MQLSAPLFQVVFKSKTGHSQTIPITTKREPYAVLSLEMLVDSDFDKVAGTAIYFLQHYNM